MLVGTPFELRFLSSLSTPLTSSLISSISYEDLQIILLLLLLFIITIFLSRIIPACRESKSFSTDSMTRWGDQLNQHKQRGQNLQQSSTNPTKRTTRQLKEEDFRHIGSLSWFQEFLHSALHDHTQLVKVIPVLRAKKHSPFLYFITDQIQDITRMFRKFLFHSHLVTRKPKRPADYCERKQFWIIVSTPHRHPVPKHLPQASRGPVPPKGLFKARPNEPRNDTLEKDMVYSFRFIAQRAQLIALPFQFF